MHCIFKKYGTVKVLSIAPICTVFLQVSFISSSPCRLPILTMCNRIECIVPQSFILLQT